METNESGMTARDGVVTLTRMCGKAFALRREDGKVKARPIPLPDLGPVPVGGGKVLWMWGASDVCE